MRELPYEFDLLYDIKMMHQVEAIAKGDPSCSDASPEELVELFIAHKLPIPDCLKEVKAITELYGMVKVDFTDHEFAKFMKDNDLNWTWEHVAEYTRFIAHGRIIALVKYKNDYPVARRIWIRKDLDQKGFNSWKYP